MTMQVGMVGTDGVIIAGDTQWTATPRLVDRYWAAGRYGYNSSKMRISEERGIAISCARDMGAACSIADKIITDLKDKDFVSPVAAIQEIAAKVSSASRQKQDAHCLVALVHPTPQLFLFQFVNDGEQWVPQCEKMDSKALAGDTLNAAIFWAEKYYERVPIEHLMPLAAHLVVCAHELNTATISGLEIVLCDTSGIRRLSNDSVNELQLRAKEWDRSIGQLLFGHRQQFTYAPNVIG
jgi:hypothetical protein